MSFHEKSTAAMLGGVVLVYCWYFQKILAIAGSAPVDEKPVAVASIAGLLAVTIGALVAIAIVAHIIIAIYEQTTTGDVDDAMDERDELIELKSERWGSHVLSVGALGILVMILMGYSMFWTANALLGAMVLSTIVKGSSKLIYYRRGV